MPPKAARTLFLSCEHGGNVVPAPLARHVRIPGNVLTSHRGFDPGALDLFDHLRPLAAAAISNRLSRLLIEFNRSDDSKDLFSRYSRDLLPDLRRLLLEGYSDYRTGFKQQMEIAMKDGLRITHVSVHTFTPVLDGKVRAVDVGLLYDPARQRETDLCDAWRNAIRLRAPGLRVRLNHPYKGTSDGYTTALRKTFPATRYQGIELEVNQRFVKKNVMDAELIQVLFHSLRSVMG